MALDSLPRRTKRGEEEEEELEEEEVVAAESAQVPHLQQCSCLIDRERATAACTAEAQVWALVMLSRLWGTA